MFITSIINTCSSAVLQCNSDHVTTLVLQPSTRQLPEEQVSPLTNVSLAQAHSNKLQWYLDAVVSAHLYTDTAILTTAMADTV